jgi:hypothetical protein
MNVSTLYAQLIVVLRKLLATIQSKETSVSMPTNPINPDILNPDWSIPENAKHNVRVLCDLAGLTLYSKNVITACIEVESGFRIGATHDNRDALGNLLSTDYGICQINDFYHIGPDKDFPSVGYVMTHPQECVVWMIKMMQEGHLNMWVSYSSGAYKQFLPK